MNHCGAVGVPLSAPMGGLDLEIQPKGQPGAVVLPHPGSARFSVQTGRTDARAGAGRGQGECRSVAGPDTHKRKRIGGPVGSWAFQVAPPGAGGVR